MIFMIEDDDKEYDEYLKKDRKGQILGILKGLLVIGLFVLGGYFLQLGIGGGLGFGLLGGTGASSAGGNSVFTVLGFLIICLDSFFMTIQTKKKKPKRQTLTILGCTDPSCKGKKVRDYHEGDYVFKEEGKCGQCDGMLRIEEIYSVQLKTPKDVKQHKREEKIEIVPKV